MSWAAYTKRASANSGESGGKYIRLKNDGDKVKVVILGAPMERWAYRDSSGSVSNAPPGVAKEHDDHWVGYMVNVYNVDAKAPAILDMSPGLLKAVGAVLEDFDTDRVFLVKRSGTGKSTTWSVQNVDKLDYELRALIAGEQPFDLEDEGCVSMVDETATPDVPAPGADDDIPF